MSKSSPHPPAPAGSQRVLTSAPGEPSAQPDGMPATSFVTREQLQAAVAVLPTTTDKAWRQHNGPRYRMEFSASSVRITSTDYSRSAKTDDRAQEAKLRKTAAMLAAEAKDAPGKRTSTDLDWSQKSRARMPIRFATCDYSAMFEQGQLPCMVTLTYPMEWQRLTPTPKAFKDHVALLRNRFLNSWGDRKNAWAGIWKMEFQERGAVHLHIGSTVPEGVRSAPLSQDDLTHNQDCAGCHRGAHTGLFGFSDWLARVWAYIIFKDVEAPSPWSVDGWANEKDKSERVGTAVDWDASGRYSDPKQIAIYFAKHGLWDKEYQNHGPELWKRAVEAGERSANFWGLWVVRPMIVSKETHEALIMHIVRHLRALADRVSYSHKTRLVKGGHNPRTGEVWEARPRKRPVHRRVKRWRNRNGYGYVLVNDAVGMLPDIARLLAHYGQAFVVQDPDDLSWSPDDPTSSPGEASASADVSALWARWEQLPLDYFDSE